MGVEPPLIKRKSDEQKDRSPVVLPLDFLKSK